MTVQTLLPEAEKIPQAAKSKDFSLIIREEPTLEEFRRALPAHKKNSLDRIIRTALTEYRGNKDLQKCTTFSIQSSLMKICQLGLEVGGVSGQAYLIPYGTQCTMQVGYRGDIELLYRSGYVSRVQPNVVYENDDFSLEMGTEPKINHRVNVKQSRGAVIGFYVVAHLKAGVETSLGAANYVSHYMSVDEINKHRDKYAKSRNFWDKEYNEMALKTVMKRLRKWLPQSSEMAEAASYEREESDKFETLMVPENGEIYTTKAQRIADMIPDDEPMAEMGEAA